MQYKPLISILCAIRNDERFIRETLDTVVSQTYPDWELIIMDAASTDRTPQILKEYSEKHANIIFRSEPDNGQWHALDKALALARGEFIYLLCGQDGFLDKEWFARCMRAFEENPEVSLVWGVPFNMSEDGELLGPHYAYARYLKDDRYGLQTKAFSTLAAKIDWRRPNMTVRIRNLMRKFTLGRIRTFIRNRRKVDMPQKEDWFYSWLEHTLPFPEANMCIRKEVYERNTVRFPEEKLGNKAIMDFSFNFNSRGYLSYGLPVGASFGRTHAGGQPLLAFDDMVISNYQRNVRELKERVEREKSFTFIDPAGDPVSTRTIS
jgi:glycosyltransferase involved in cell wall biosynthesis